jgi:DNA invertase Pin-like site-specific DNA recombinase
MAPLLIGYARVSTDQQDLTAQRHALSQFGVSSDRTCLDHGLIGTIRQRPGLREGARSVPRRRHTRRHKARSPRAVAA